MKYGICAEVWAKKFIYDTGQNLQ